MKNLFDILVAVLMVDVLLWAAEEDDYVKSGNVN